MLYSEGPKSREQRRRLVSFMRKVVAAYPNDDRYRASLGKALFEDQDCASAQPIFAELAGRTPVDADNLNLLALTSWCLGETSRAEDAFKRSLAVNPNQPVVKQGLDAHSERPVSAMSAPSVPRKVSVVVPVYNEEANLPALLPRLLPVLRGPRPAVRGRLRRRRLARRFARDPQESGRGRIPAS